MRPAVSQLAVRMVKRPGDLASDGGFQRGQSGIFERLVISRPFQRRTRDRLEMPKLRRAHLGFPLAGIVADDRA